MSVDHFVQSIRESSVPPVRSLVDVDFYKFTMGQVIRRHFPNTWVIFKVILRNPNVHLGRAISEAVLRDALDAARELRFSRTDLYYLRGMDLYGRYMFSEEYLEYLRGFALPPYRLEAVGDDFEITFPGPWSDTSMWETIVLAIISQLYYRAVLQGFTDSELQRMYARAINLISTKLETIAQHPRIRFADFGQRRRHSFLWQKWVVGLAKEMLGEQFVGTSNTWMAFHHDLPPIGTNAHELPMVLTALLPDAHKPDAQYEVLRLWQDTYGQGLRIFLPDTYGTDQFLQNAPEWVANWRGFRQDSGDPIVQGRKYIEWLRWMGKDPHEKLMIPSDGLDVDGMIAIDESLGDDIPLSFGWGTLFTNDFRNITSSQEMNPFSIVCKVVEADGKPCVKLSDNPAKATGPQDEIERYLKIFGYTGKAAMPVFV